MQVTAKQNERRQHQREYDAKRQLKIIVNDQEILTENWSIGGFRSYGLFRYDKKDRFQGLVARADGGPGIPFVGRIIRVEEDGARVVSLVEIELDDLLALQETKIG